MAMSQVLHGKICSKSDEFADSIFISDAAFHAAVHPAYVNVSLVQRRMHGWHSSCT